MPIVARLKVLHVREERKLLSAHKAADGITIENYGPTQYWIVLEGNVAMSFGTEKPDIAAGDWMEITHVKATQTTSSPPDPKVERPEPS